MNDEMFKNGENADLKLNNNALSDEKNAAFSGWKQKIKFDRSFYAKLILADKKQKEYYAAISTELLSYKKIRSITGRQGVSFISGKTRIAFISFSGKTLRLYLALNPEEISGGKYKAKNVGDVKRRATTPALLKIKSDGALKNALKLICLAAENAGAGEKDLNFEPVKAENFKTDSFNNLITRGLIRILRSSPHPADFGNRTGGENKGSEDEKCGYKSVNGTFGGETPTEKAGNAGDGNDSGKESIKAETFELAEKTIGKKNALDVYDDTLISTDELLSRHNEYNDILNALAQGDGKIKLTQKLMLRSLDEIWVRAIEDCLPALDVLIRNPARFIAETEEVLPIELTKRINARSVSHLCRHTDYISPGENGDVTPTKMLNVFREDSVLTYENKFLNTLINRLYVFVSRRFAVAQKLGADEKTQSFEFENDFETVSGKACVKISVEYSQKNLKKAEKTLSGTGLWKRAERLNAVISAYMNSSFVKSMDKNFVHPPVMRTNAILKNKYFRECLALWEFIESYNDAGYGITVDETSKNVCEDYVKQVYALAAEQYLVFRRNFESDEKGDLPADLNGENKQNFSKKPVLRPETIAESDDFEEEFIDGEPDYSALTAKKSEASGEYDDLSLALAVALKADEIISDDEYETVLIKSFAAKLSEASDEVKRNFADISNELLKRKKVKMRLSRRYAAFNAGRIPLAKITASEKFLKIYLALDPAEILKTEQKTADFKVKFEDTPALVKVSGGRSLKRALNLIQTLCDRKELAVYAEQNAEIKAEDFPVLSEEEMLLSGLITVAKRKKSNFAALKNENKQTNNAAESAAGDISNVKIGVKKDETVEKACEALSEVVVSEPPAIAPVPDVSPEYTEAVAFNLKEKEAEEIAEKIEKVVRPVAEYEKPTEFGIDDSSGFMRFEEEELVKNSRAAENDGNKQ